VPFTPVSGRRHGARRSPVAAESRAISDSGTSGTSKSGDDGATLQMDVEEIDTPDSASVHGWLLAKIFNTLDRSFAEPRRNFTLSIVALERWRTGVICKFRISVYLLLAHLHCRLLHI